MNFDLLLEALIGAFGFGTALIVWLRARSERKKTQKELTESKNTVKSLEREMDFQAHVLSFASFIGDWDNTAKEIADLVRTTEIDRVIIFCAWNGAMTPRHTTSVWQFREMGQEPVNYVHFVLDQDYQQRMQDMIRHGTISFSVKDLPPSKIKDVYNLEKVKSSMWGHITSEKLQDSESVSISYISWSSHTAEEISLETRSRCMILAGRLKGVAQQYAASEKLSAIKNPFDQMEGM